ncbi:hypothetical protein NQZ79_g7465 [Umbelopsis isabellina]|nr:hypothetical protein NQZ79_g7465 [Umbelopsis isabellina]
MSRVSLKDEEPISTNLLLTPDGVSQKSGGKKRPPLLKRLSASSLRTITNRDTTNADDTHGQAGVNNTVETRLEERSSTPSKSEFFSHQRKHSNTISGEMRPLSVETRIPSPPRRSSDGSPRQSLYPTTINISAPTPTTATFSKEVFSTATTGLTFELLQSQDNISYPEHREHDLGNRDRPPTPIAPPEESQEPYNSVVSSPTTLGPILGQRARGISTSTMSSTTSLGSIGPDLSRSSSTPTSKLATSGRPSRRRESLDTAVSSEGGFSTAAGSIATACGLEVANTKRNAEFHALFRSVPEDDLLIEGVERRG